MLPIQLFSVLLGVASSAGISAADLELALHGKVALHTEIQVSKDGTSIFRGSGVIVIERSTSDVWATVARYDDKAEYIPRLKSVVILEERPDHVRARMSIDAMLTTSRYTAAYTMDEKKLLIRWELDKTVTDNTISDLEGEYRLFEIAPRRTLVVYHTFVDSGQTIPKFIQNYMAGHSIPDMLKSLKKRVESGGVWKK